MLAIGFIVAIIYMFNSTQKNKKVALDKGVENDDLTIFAISLWIYALPPVIMFLFSDSISIILAIILILFYIPGIVMSRKLSVKLDTGFDFERKAGKQYDKVMWLGFAGIGFVLANFLFLSANALLRNAK
jgi:hypothetical protein